MVDTAPGSPASQPSPPDAAAGIAWIWRPGLIALVLRNAGLLVCTAGLHRVWGVAAWRRHVWSRIVLRGDPFEFVGTGLDGFKGFLIAAAILAPLLAASAFLVDLVAAERPEARPIALAARLAMVFALFGVWRFFRLRYLLSRTRWRGFAPALDADFGAYARFALPLAALNALALGLLTPWVWQRRQAWLIARMRLGGARLSGAPDWRPLALPWLCVWAAAAVLANWAATQPLGLGPQSGRLQSGTVPAVASVALILAFAAYRMAAWRSFANALRVSSVTLASRARPGFAVARVVLAALLLCVLVGTGGIAAAMLSSPLPGGAGLVRHALSAVAVIVSLALVRDTFLAPAAVAHAVATLEIAGAEALDAIAAAPLDAHGRAPLDVGPG